MQSNQTTSIGAFMDQIIARNPNQLEFHQAVHEFVEEVIPFIEREKQYQGYNLLNRLTEPDKTFSFRVTWVDDDGQIQVNKGYRVQFNNAIGPYKGGLRFHPSVNLSILKFLGFEQIFKNSLTGLPMGGGKGGSDFNPKGKSDGEIMRFCQAFMTKLAPHIGQFIDVPAGDIGVGSQEIGYLFGQYKLLTRQHEGVLTGKPRVMGGSLIRPEATGYGCVYFVQEMLKQKDLSFTDMKVNISGSGNVAQFAAEKTIELGGSVQTMSDSSGSIFDPEGINLEKLEWIKDLKNNRKGRIKEYADKFNVQYMEGRPWSIPCDIALPCATQNEINQDDALTLVKNGCVAIGEGANMPTSIDGIKVFKDSKVLYAPGKASNAGGVATSGLEMSQNSLRLSWTREEVDQRLKSIMLGIHERCEAYGKQSDGTIDYVAGANIAGFVQVADAMILGGVV